MGPTPLMRPRTFPLGMRGAYAPQASLTGAPCQDSRWPGLVRPPRARPWSYGRGNSSHWEESAPNANSVSAGLSRQASGVFLSANNPSAKIVGRSAWVMRGAQPPYHRGRFSCCWRVPTLECIPALVLATHLKSRVVRRLQRCPKVIRPARPAVQGRTWQQTCATGR